MSSVTRAMSRSHFFGRESQDNSARQCVRSAGGYLRHLGMGNMPNVSDQGDVVSGESMRGLRVVELSEVWAGPFGCSLLGDLGADVIKLETYPRNSETRPLREPDPRVADGDGPVYERVNTHHHGNRNKRNIAVDIRTPEGAAILRRLIEWADVLVESFSAGTIERMGFGWDAVHSINPRLTMVSLAGWGQEGPYDGYIMFGVGFDAMTGHASVRGYPDGTMENVIPILHSDATVPLAWIFGVVGALMERERSGEGSYIDLAQIEELSTNVPQLIAEWTLNHRLPQRLGDADPYMVPHGCYRAAGEDTWVNIAAQNDLQWATLARVAGHPEWAEDGHAWASVAGRVRERDAVDDAVGEYAASADPWVIADALQESGVIAAPVLAPSDALLSPQLHAREWFQAVDHPYLPDRLLGGFLWRMSPDGPAWDRRAALLGEHNTEVLIGLGYSKRDIEELRIAGAIGDRYPDPV